MKSKKILFYLFFLLSFNIYSQQLFNKNGERDYSDTLNIKLLHRVCDNLKISFSDIYTLKSNSIEYNNQITFFALRYIIKNSQDGNLYTTKYLFADNTDGKVIDQVDDKETYYEEEAVHPSSPYILKNSIRLSDNIIGIGIITEESIGSCATLYSEQKFSIISLLNNKLIILLDNYTIRKINGESNCSGNYEIEILEKSIDLMKHKTNGLFDLSITKKFKYEDIVEEDPEKNIKERKVVKNKTEIEKLSFNGKNYNFEEDNIFRFLKW